MAAYVDYAYYTTTYLGAAIASADFARLASRASAMIDIITYNRAVAIILADTDDDTIDKIQMATCAVAEVYGMLEKLPGESGGEIASERVGNVSVTYVQNSTSTISDNAKMMNAARMYLLNTDLLYPGFNEDEI
jgi:hypothetical protein